MPTAHFPGREATSVGDRTGRSAESEVVIDGVSERAIRRERNGSIRFVGCIRTRWETGSGFGSTEPEVAEHWERQTLATNQALQRRRWSSGQRLFWPPKLASVAPRPSDEGEWKAVLVAEGSALRPWREHGEVDREAGIVLETSVFRAVDSGVGTQRRDGEASAHQSNQRRRAGSQGTGKDRTETPLRLCHRKIRTHSLRLVHRHGDDLTCGV